MGKSSLEKHSEILISNLFVNWKNLEGQPKTNIQNSNFKSMDELEKVMSLFKSPCWK